jgi:hypothetical protein
VTALHAAGWPPPAPDDRDDTSLSPVRGCAHRVPASRVMCPGDWRRCPKPVQRAVYATWDNGAGAGTPAHTAAMLRAIAAVNRVREREAEEAGR